LARGKIERIIAALGLHVLADKPAIIEPADLPRLDLKKPRLVSDLSLCARNRRSRGLSLKDAGALPFDRVKKLVTWRRRAPLSSGEPVKPAPGSGLWPARGQAQFEHALMLDRNLVYAHALIGTGGARGGQADQLK
jgi:hypothetical protein